MSGGAITASRWREALRIAGEQQAARIAALEAARERVRRMGEDHAEYRKNATAALEARDRTIAELMAALEAPGPKQEEADALLAANARVAELEDLRQRDIERIGAMDAWIETAETRIAALEAGVRRALEFMHPTTVAAEIARDLLAGRAAGGEG